MIHRSPRLRIPYKGLAPFEEEDVPLFFGRASDQRIITANLQAYHLTILYAASGVGKTSILRAGVVANLRQQIASDQRRRRKPHLAVVLYGGPKQPWRNDPIRGLSRAIKREVAWTLGKKHERLQEAKGLSEIAQVATRLLDGYLLIILDQFEEYLRYHADEDGEGTFSVEFPRLLDQPGLRVNFLLAIREDALAKLDRFKGRIPDLFRNYLRLDPLDQASGQEAIVKPITEYYNQRVSPDKQIECEPDLVQAILDQVPLESDDSFPESKNWIEVSSLQLAMQQIWKKRGARSRVLERSTLDYLDGVEGIWNEHVSGVLDRLMPDEKDIAARIFNFLITPSGAKIAHSAEDLASYISDPEKGGSYEVEAVRSTLEQLAQSGVRILQTVQPPRRQPQLIRYELFHDKIGRHLLKWRERFLAKRIETKLTHDLRQGMPSSDRLVEQANALELTDQDRLRFAFEAILSAKTREAEQTLKNVLISLQREPLQGLAFVRQIAHSQNGNLLAATSADLGAGIWSVTDGSRIAVLEGHKGIIQSIAFSPDDRFLLTASADKTARIWDAKTGIQVGDSLVHPAGVAYAEFHPNSAILLTVSGENVARLWQWNGDARPARFIDSVDEINRATFSPNGNYMLTGYSKPEDESGSEEHPTEHRRMQIWKILPNSKQPFNQTPIATLEAELGEGANPSFSPNGLFVLQVDPEGIAHVWDWRKQTRVATLSRADINFLDGHFSPDGEKVLLWSNPQASATESEQSPSFSACVWTWETESVLPLILEGNPFNTVFADFSPDSKQVVTAHDNGTCYVWDADRGGVVMQLFGHSGRVNRALFDPSGKFIATAGEDGKAAIYPFTRYASVDELIAAAKSQLAALSSRTETVPHRRLRKPRPSRTENIRT